MTPAAANQAFLVVMATIISLGDQAHVCCHHPGPRDTVVPTVLYVGRSLFWQASNAAATHRLAASEDIGTRLLPFWAGDPPQTIEAALAQKPWPHKTIPPM